MWVTHGFALVDGDWSTGYEAYKTKGVDLEFCHERWKGCSDKQGGILQSGPAIVLETHLGSNSRSFAVPSYKSELTALLVNLTLGVQVEQRQDGYQERYRTVCRRWN